MCGEEFFGLSPPTGSLSIIFFLIAVFCPIESNKLFFFEAGGRTSAAPKNNQCRTRALSLLSGFALLFRNRRGFVR